MSYTILPIREKQIVDSYPYGRLRTTAFFSIEFVPGKGFRSVFQTINPKNGRHNAPKKSTYSHLAYLVRNEDNGHIEVRGFGIGGYEDVNKVSAFLAENAGKLDMDEEMIKDVCGTIFTCIRANAKWTSAPAEQLLPLLEPAVKTSLHGFKTGENVFSQIKIDTEAIDRLREPAKFTVTETMVIS